MGADGLDAGAEQGGGLPPAQTIVCMRWGTVFGPEYVNRLFRAVQRHVTRPTRFVVFCDDPAGLDVGIEAFSIPPIQLANALKRGPWRKLALWSDNLANLSGPVLFLDLDVIVTGPLDAFFDVEPGKLMLILNWTQKHDGIGNSSVMRFVVGSAPHLLREFEAGGAAFSHAIDNEQIFVSQRSGLPIAFWPDGWCRSFKHELLPPWPQRLWQEARLLPGTRIAVFTGEPRPRDAMAGRWPAKWYKRFYKRLRPVTWIKDHWY